MSEETNDNPSETVTDGQDVSPAEGDENVIETTTPKANEVKDTLKDLSLEELNTQTGRTYATKEEALKGIAETFKFVGKAGQPQEVDPNKFISREQYETDTFFAKNEAYKEYQPLISDIAKSREISVAEVVKLDEFKGIFEKAEEADKLNSAKSVLESNPKLGNLRNKMTQATESFEEAQKASHANDPFTANRKMEDAKKGVVGAVLDSLQE